MTRRLVTDFFIVSVCGSVRMEIIGETTRFYLGLKSYHPNNKDISVHNHNSIINADKLDGQIRGGDGVSNISLRLSFIEAKI